MAQKKKTQRTKSKPTAKSQVRHYLGKTLKAGGSNKIDTHITTHHSLVKSEAEKILDEDEEE
jgi:hypothetical protein